MFQKMRRKDRKLSKEKTLDILKEGTFGVLGTVGKDGYPYTVPLNYVYYLENLYFHCAKEGHKLINIEFNNKTSFTVVTDHEVIAEKFTTRYKSVIVFGKVLKVDGEEKKEALVELINKFSPDFKKKGIKYIENTLDKVKVLKLEIDRLTGKGNIG